MATALSVQSDMFHASATLDATSGNLSGLTGAGATIADNFMSMTVTTAGVTKSFIVIPGTAVADISFMATINGQDYTARTAVAQPLQAGYIYTYTFTLSASGFTVSSVGVTPWNKQDMGTLELQKKLSGSAIDATGKANGAYIVTATGQLVDYATVDNTAIGVALITDNQRILIEKNSESNTTSIKAAYDADGASNTDYTNFYWGPYGTDVSSITNWTGGDGKSIPTDYTTWKSNSTYAWNDYNGKSNTAALLNLTDSDSYTTYANAVTYCKKFNETPLENQGYTDWYIPACGQLALIYINRTEINAALTKIGGTTLNTSFSYWSSSEYSSIRGWSVYFYNGLIFWYDKSNNDRVRLLRDF